MPICIADGYRQLGGGTGGLRELPCGFGLLVVRHDAAMVLLVIVNHSKRHSMDTAHAQWRTAMMAAPAAARHWTSAPFSLV